MVGVVFLSGPRLLDWANSPPHLQFNKYVLTGYRPALPLGECVRSLFYPHNELGNIYTHGIPLLCFVFLLPLAMPWSQITVPWLAVAHYLACVSPQLGSVLYHLFMNHEGGAPIYQTLLTLDMCGVCMVNTLGALPIIYCTLLCAPALGRGGARPGVQRVTLCLSPGALPIIYCTLLCAPVLRTLALTVYVCLSSYVIYCAVSAQSNVRRLRAFTWQACFRFFFFLLRWLGFGAGSPTALRCYLLMDGLAVLGGFINVVRVPERWAPGAFDYCCNSHQIMHVLVVASILYLHWGVLEDLHWISAPRCPVAHP